MRNDDDSLDLEDPIALELDDEEENDEDESAEETEDDAEGRRDGSDGDAPLKEGAKEDGSEDERVLKGGRRERAVLKARERERVEREHRERTEKTVQELQEEIRQLRAPKVDPELERQRLELMTPEERMLEYKKDIDRKIQMAEFKAFESADRAAYSAKAASNPLYAKYADQIERTLEQQRRMGNNFPREELLAYLVGQAALKRGSEVSAKARKTGASNIKKQTTKPSKSQSNVSADPDRRVQTLEEKLDGIFI